MLISFINELEQSLNETLLATSFGVASAKHIVFWVLFLTMLVLAIIMQYSVRFVLRLLFERSKEKISFSFFKYLRDRRFPHYLAQLVPVNFLMNSISEVFKNYPKNIGFLLKITEAYLVFVIIWMILSVIKSVIDALKEKPAFKEKPMESWVQVIHITLICIGIFFIYNIFTDRPFTELIGYLGAASAVLLLIFKDTILGFVASITVTTNDMVRIGDWITMPESNADGDVIEINLNTVKVQNFDKTITTIPTYKLISNSFQNWRGMQNSGGRRMKRAINIIQSTVRFVEEDDLIRLSQIQEISGYIAERRREIQEYNSEKQVDKRVLINGRNMTNLGLFRKYADYYLKNHPRVNKNLTMMVRQLATTSKGIPLEVYAFTDTVNWVEYEGIQSDIFDHLIAAVPYFDLEIFEDLHNIPQRQGQKNTPLI